MSKENRERRKRDKKIGGGRERKGVWSQAIM
jgi:hypothetical protein